MLAPYQNSLCCSHKYWMTTLVISSALWASPWANTTHVLILVTYTIPPILPILLCWFPSPLASMLMTLFFSMDSEAEAKFQTIFSKLLPVDFIDIIEWFLGIHFSWHTFDSDLEVHLNQTGFVYNLVECFTIKKCAPTPNATPYWYGLPINPIQSVSADKSFPTQVRCKDIYQSLIVSIGWLENNTRPDISPSNVFLSSYIICPSSGHIKVALYILHYIYSHLWSWHQFLLIGPPSHPHLYPPSWCV